MVKQILGFQRVEYDKKDGSGHVSGVFLYIGTVIPDERGQGFACDKVYVKSALFPEDWSCGTYNIEYDVGYEGKAFISKISQV